MEVAEDQDKQNEGDSHGDKEVDSASKDTDSSSMFVTAFPQPSLYPSLPPVDTVDPSLPPVATVDTDGQSPAKETSSSMQSASNSSPTSNKTRSSHRRKGPASRRVATDKQSTKVPGTDTNSQKVGQDSPHLAKLLSSREPKQPLDTLSKDDDLSLASLLEQPTTSHVPVSKVLEAYKYGMQKGMEMGTSSRNTEQASSNDTDLSFLTALADKSVGQVLSLIPISLATPTDHPLGTVRRNGSANVQSAKDPSPKSTHLGKRQTPIKQEHSNEPLPGSILPPLKRSRPSVSPGDRIGANAVSELGRPTLGSSVKNTEATKSNNVSHHSKYRSSRQSPRIKVVKGTGRPKHSRSSSLDSVASGLAAMLAQPVASTVGSKERQRSSTAREGVVRGSPTPRPAAGVRQSDSASPSKKKKQQSWIANLFNH